MNPDLFRIQTRLPLRPSTNMSHTTYVKHTGYQVNIIHHEAMFQVTINDIVQYICQCRIRPPNRAGGNATRHGTDANSGDGWVGSLVVGVAFRSSVQKCQLHRHSNSVFEHRCWPRHTGRSNATALYRRNSVGTRARPPNPIPAHSRWPKPTKVSRYIGL